MTTATKPDPAAPALNDSAEKGDSSKLLEDTLYGQEDVPAPTPSETQDVPEPKADIPPQPEMAAAPQPEPEKPEEKKDQEESQRVAARRLGNEVKELKGQVQALAEENTTLKAKLDGTYKEPPQPTPEQVMARAEFNGREVASRAVAHQLFGEEFVKTQVYDDKSPYEQLIKQKPWLHARVVRHDQPAVEAVRVLKEQEFMTTYGTDPSQWVSKIEAELRPKLFAEFKKSQGAAVVGETVPGITEARGSGGHAPQKSLADRLYG